jgi:hypothetical protein
MHPIDFYLRWAIRVSKETGVSARWWTEHHGWKGVCWLIENGGEEAMSESFDAWRQPSLPLGRA